MPFFVFWDIPDAYVLLPCALCVSVIPIVVEMLAEEGGKRRGPAEFNRGVFWVFQAPFVNMSESLCTDCSDLADICSSRE